MSDAVVLRLLKEEVDRLPLRYDKYGRDVFETVAEILLLERKNKVRALNIQKQVSDQCAALGERLAGKQAAD